jgi:signal transduction histidine kinase
VIAGDDVRVRATRVVSLLLVVAGGLSAAQTVMVVRAQPEVTYAGSSGWLLVLELAAGMTLVGAGAVATMRAPTRATGLLAAAAGAAWLTREWGSPSAGSSAVFTAGLVLAVVGPALLVHAALRFPGTPRAWPLVIPVGYAVVVGWEGVAPVLFLDPQAGGCAECPTNLLFVADRGGWADAVQRSGLWAGAGWAVLAAAQLVWVAGRASSAWRRVAVPFMAAVAALLVATAWGNARTALSWTPQAVVDDRLWVVDATVLTVAGAGLLYERVRARQVRVSLAHLALDLAGRGPDTGLVPTLARLSGDPTLTVLYPLEDQTLVDARGNPTDLPPGRDPTVLSRAGQPIAYLLHRPGALDDDAAMTEIGTVATMSVDHERHQALSQAHMAALRASRARIVATRDAERRRLERDLHDGAQQRLVTLALQLRLAQTTSAADGALSALLDRCAAEVTAALAELRTLAHGLYPAALADEGIEAALQVLAEGAPLTLDTVGIADRRYPERVESSAYFTIAHLVRHCVHDQGRLSATQTDTTLRFELDIDGDAPTEETLGPLEDRVGALDGSLTLARRDQETATVLLELPCG